MRKIQIIVGLDPAQNEALQKASKQERRSKSEIVRIALEMYLKSREGKNGH